MSLVHSLAMPSSYKDLQYQGTTDQLSEELQTTSTLYVGNLSFYTTEEQIHELFSKTGEIKRIIMGLDRNQKTPCGFCFVEYFQREGALGCMKYLNGSKLDERMIRCDLDPGFREGRQYGRGRSGGQVRDEYRDEYDAGRGGWGHRVRDALNASKNSNDKRQRDDSEEPQEESSSKRAKENNPRFREDNEDEDEE
ncbi:hypothetical protein BC940DRAFT_365209 [Gongronella butleri]|nr:hypothetical protein BC940DRAFT_365209 [Gongronella butleri]